MKPEPLETPPSPPPEYNGWQDSPSCDPQMLAMVPRVKILPGQTAYPPTMIRGIFGFVKKPCEWVSETARRNPAQIENFPAVPSTVLLGVARWKNKKT